MTNRARAALFSLWCIYIGFLAGEIISDSRLPPRFWACVATVQASALLYLALRTRLQRVSISSAAPDDEFISQLRTTFGLITRLFDGPVTISFVTDKVSGRTFLKITCPHCHQDNRLTKGISGAICGSCKKTLRSVRAGDPAEPARLVN